MEDILLASEIELSIHTMDFHDMECIGTDPWLEWHQRIQKLNQQAIIEASAVKEEFVKETLITYAKIPILVHEAILINVWKYKVLPHLLRMEPNPQSTLVAYTVLYHEAVCVALLELIMYHANASEALEDASSDLLDYAFGAASQLLVLKSESESDKERRCELMRQKDDLSFGIGIRCLTILRYLADYLERLPLRITVQMFKLNDVPVFLTQLLLEKPWIRNGKLYSEGEWKEWDGEVLGTVEAQVWLALRQLLLDPSCPTHYEITNSRRSQLMKLQALITPILLDQLSPLIELQQWLHYLSVNNQSVAPQKPILLEMSLEIKEKILQRYEGKWKKLAKQQLPIIFGKDHKQLVKVAQSLSEAYNTELLEKFEELKKPVHYCVQCNKNAIQRCSHCKKQWYCSRHCQVLHWTQHKEICMQAPDENVD